MANQPTAAPTANPTLQATQVFVLAFICLVVGLAIGYLLRGTHTRPSQAQPAAIGAANATPAPNTNTMRQMPGNPAQSATSAPQTSPHAAMGGGSMPTMLQMKQMADKRAAPLLQKLKSDPNNSALLVQVGAIYHTTHQFQTAAAYYGKAVQLDPKNVADRTKLAASIFRSGDPDGAIAQLNQALRYDPKDANALFDLGMIKLQGKQDGRGALAAWQQLLKANPQLSPDRKAAVQKMMAEVATMLGDQHGMKGAGSNDPHESNSN